MLLDFLEDYCDFRRYSYCRLDGNTSLDEREQYMNDFNNTDAYQIFLLSTKAGGLGINLTGADTVIIYDIDWNPQNDIQAMDRAYRIGQTKTVHVYKMITEFTIEERISEFQKYKLIWDELVIQKGAFMDKKKKDDPFSNFNCQSLVNLGKGEIFRLEVDNNDRTIEEILMIGEEKDKKANDEIKERVRKNLEEMNLTKINPF
jgi:SWI/SNF-related matrix-associated actin-dependent regulator of chromatin subfamily A member 5